VLIVLFLSSWRRLPTEGGVPLVARLISGICHFRQIGICQYLVNESRENYFCDRLAAVSAGKELL